MATYITEKGLEYLKTHEYKQSPQSSLDRKLADMLWNRLVTYIPRWIAPNLITLAGFAFLTSSVALVLAHDTTLSKDLPRWNYLYAGIALFVYQTLDALDGKQARITGCTTPLGQFFDRICDVFACTCLAIIGCQLLVLGNSVMSVAFQCTLSVAFFLSDWEYFHLGESKASLGNFGITEVQCIVIGALLTTGLLGRNIWNSALSGVAVAVTLLVAGIFIIGLVRRVLKNNKQKLRSLSLLLPISTVVALAGAWTFTEYYRARPALVILAIGLEFFLVNAKFILSTMCRTKFSILQLEPLILVLPLVNMGLKVPNVVVYVGTLVAISGVACMYVVSVISEMAEYFGISCFTIVPKEVGGEEKLD